MVSMTASSAAAARFLSPSNRSASSSMNSALLGTCPPRTVLLDHVGRFVRNARTFGSRQQRNPLVSQHFSRSCRDLGAAPKDSNEAESPYITRGFGLKDLIRPRLWATTVSARIHT